MCACKQKKSFFIEDILKDVKKKPYKNLSNEPTKPLICKKEAAKKEESSKYDIPKDKEQHNTEIEVNDDKFDTENVTCDYKVIKFNNRASDDGIKKFNDGNIAADAKFSNKNANYDQTKYSYGNIQKHNDHVKFNVISEVQSEIEFSKINLEHRRNTYPLYPMPMKANLPWQHKKEPIYNSIRLDPRQFSYYSDPLLNSGGLLRNQMALNRFVAHPYTIRQAYGFDRGKFISTYVYVR